MRFHQLSAIPFILITTLLTFTLPTQARIQMQPTSNDLHAAESSLAVDHMTASYSTRPVRVIPSVDPQFLEEHEFELFNNSYRDILFLHLIPLNSPEEEMVFGGTRRLIPGRAWRVNLNRGCLYSLLVEYEDGAQTFYEEVNTCDYHGLQLR
jgi:hypothetical protein